MDEQSFKQIIEQGETINVEFKSWVKASSVKEIINLAVDELIAFANCKGGTVFLGIEDNFTEAKELSYEGKKIIAISVEPDGKIYATTDGRCLKRLGRNSKPFYPDEMSHIYSVKRSPDFSSQIIAVWKNIVRVWI